MGKFGGFYKGEKKKQKKQDGKRHVGTYDAPVFSLPDLVQKKKKTQ